MLLLRVGSIPNLQDLTFKREIDKPHFCVERNNNVKDK